MKIDGKLRILHCFVTKFWKFIETQGFLIGEICRICKEIMIFEFFVVFYAKKSTTFLCGTPETCGKGCLLGFQSLHLALDLQPKCHGSFFNQCICMVVHLAPFLMS